MGFKVKDFFITKPILAFVFLMREFNISYNQAQRWLDKKRVIYANGSTCHKSQKIFGHIKVIYFDIEYSSYHHPIFKTNSFAVFDKPVHFLSHPKDYSQTASMLDSIKLSLGNQAVLVHRLDKETSGLLIAASNVHYAQKFGKLFMDKHIQRSYYALVQGKLSHSRHITLPILKSQHKGDLSIRMSIDNKGLASHTFIKPLSYNPETNSTYVLVVPYTGRTHQIRLHLYSIGHRIIGDPLYGVDDHLSREYLESNASFCAQKYTHYFGACRLMLHAFKLQFTFNGINFALTSFLNHFNIK